MTESECSLFPPNNILKPYSRRQKEVFATHATPAVFEKPRLLIFHCTEYSVHAQIDKLATVLPLGARAVLQ